MTRRHVILATYGEPPDADFGDQLAYSWRILLGLTRTIAPIPPFLVPLLAVMRARARRALWRKEGYSSPLEGITREQAWVLEAILRARTSRIDWRVQVAYEFRDPVLGRVLDSIPRGEAVDIAPMYVADSAFTHQLSRDAAAAWQRRPRRSRPGIRVLPALDEERFAAISAEHLLDQARRRDALGPEWALVLASHGTLLDPPRPVETGRASTERIAAAIAGRVGSRFGMVQHGWLNHRFGGRWTEPPVEEALRRVGEAGFSRAVYFPFGFSADNAESELEGRIALRSAGLQSVHLPCLNLVPALLGALADQVLGSPAPQPPAEEAAELLETSAT